jgi:xylulokinase
MPSALTSSCTPRSARSVALVGLDVGTSAVKGVAIDEQGRVMATASAGYPLSRPQPGWSEQEPEDWWRAAEEVLARLPDGPGGLSGQMHGLVVLDSGQRVLRPAILWNDQRTAAECAEIEDRVGVARLLELSGNRALTGFTAPKLLWLRRHEPELYGRICHVLLPKDYVRLRLTGELAVDVADASGTLLFDVRRRVWSDEVCKALEIPLEWLPPASESTAIAGAGDQAAAALGVGIARPGPVSVVLGTSGVVFSALPAYEHDAEGRLHAFCHAVPDTWHAMGVMLSAAGSAAWLRSVLGADFVELDAAAVDAPPGCEGLLFAPYLVGERTPHPDPDVRGAFVGLSAGHDRGALWRAMLEGVAYGLRDSLELLRELGARPGSGRVSGGGARSGIWLRILASVLELPLETTESEEGSAFGAALLAGVRAGVFSDVDDAVARCVRPQRRIEPEWDYEPGYRRFRRLYPTLRPMEEP